MVIKSSRKIKRSRKINRSKRRKKYGKRCKKRCRKSCRKRYTKRYTKRRQRGGILGITISRKRNTNRIKNLENQIKRYPKMARSITGKPYIKIKLSRCIKKGSGDTKERIASIGDTAWRSNTLGNVKKVCKCITRENKKDEHKWCCVKWDNYKKYGNFGNTCKETSPERSGYGRSGYGSSYGRSGYGSSYGRSGYGYFS